MKEQLIKQYREKRNKAVKDISDKFDIYYSDKHDDLESIIKFINFTDSYVSYLLDMVEVVEGYKLETNSKNESLNRVLSTFRVDGAFNMEKAKIWLSKALNLVVVDGYSYKAPFFIKGDSRILKTKI
jgi:hypothetical protein